MILHLLKEFQKGMFHCDQLSVYKLLTCVARFTGTFITIDLVNAGPIVTGIALAIINIDFTVDSCEKRFFLVNVNNHNVMLASLFICVLPVVPLGQLQM